MRRHVSCFLSNGCDRPPQAPAHRQQHTHNLDFIETKLILLNQCINSYLARYTSINNNEKQKKRQQHTQESASHKLLKLQSIQPAIWPNNVSPNPAIDDHVLLVQVLCSNSIFGCNLSI